MEYVSTKEKTGMSDEKKLIKQFNQGSKDALCQIYQHHKKDLYGFAMSLLHDANTAEDVIHDVFVSFAQKSGSYTLKGKLRNYLLTSVANRARDMWRQKSQNDVSLDKTTSLPQTDYSPEQYLILTEEYKLLQNVLSKIPYEQREILLLHLHHDMTFRQIACAQGVSINTVQSRYRYGLEKLSVLLKEGCENETAQTNRRPNSANKA
jgi:RNA polymerase sigma-70 factor (ECF subfamily)